MSYQFIAVFDLDEKCEWCRENLGIEGNNWNQATHSSTVGHNGMTYPVIVIQEETDAVAYKLRWC